MIFTSLDLLSSWLSQVFIAKISETAQELILGKKIEPGLL